MSKMRRNGEQTGCSWGAGGVGRLGRFSVGRLLLDSPLLGRRFVHRAAEQNELRQTRSVVVEPQVHSKSFSSNKIAVEVHTIEDDDKTLECPLCLSTLDATALPRLMMCAHRCCESCLKQYLTIEICEARVPVDCPACHEPLHPQDVKRIVDNLVLYDKYEEFCVRRALSADPDARWCPAPDCNYAVIATGCASCPKLTCLSPGCGATFCYHCKATWHPTQTCDAARRERRTPTPCSDFDHGELKSCPRCSVLIVKVEDGSCNHMVCCVCGAEFCWLCMKEVSDLHYLSPSGCTFWGKKPWSRKKKLLWQLGTLAGAPLGIALVAGVTLPALLLGLPVWAGRRAHRRLLRSSPGKRRAAVAAAVTAALIVSPVVAGLTVGIGVPILLFYVYGVVPVSLCRAGGCGGGNTEQAPKPQFEDAAGSLDAVSRRLEPSIGDASLSAGSHQTEVRAPSLAALAGSIAGNDTNDPNRIEVSADIATSDTASAISWPEDFPRMSSDAQSQLASVSRSTLLKNLFLHGTTSTDPETGFGPSTAAAPSSPAPLSRSNDRIVHINETRSLKDIS